LQNFETMSALVPHVAAMPPPIAHTLGGLYNHLLGYLSTFLKQEYRPAHFARMAKVCRRFRQFFNDLIEKWKVEAMKVLMARLGGTPCRVFALTQGEPVSVRELPQAFAQKHGKEFWPQKGFERWLQGHSEDFTIGKIGGHNYVAFKGELGLATRPPKGPVEPSFGSDRPRMRPFDSC
jgi:hypothetical protein